MTCGTLIEFCQEDFPIPPRLPPPPPILSYYFEDNKLNSSFYCDFCSNLEASLDPLHKRLGVSDEGEGFFSPTPKNLTVILFIVAALSAAVGSMITVVWRKWFRCADGGLLSKAFGASHSSHSADISTSPDGRRRSSRTASLRSSSALQNLQKRLSSSSFISRRSLYQHHPSNMISSHRIRSGAQMANNTYCECPSSMMMMMCSTSGASGVADPINNLNNSTSSTTTSLSPCLATGIDPSAPSASTLSISSNGGNVYAELDPVSIHQLSSPYPVYGPSPAHYMTQGIITNMPLAVIGNIQSPATNQYVLNQRKRQPAPLPPIPTPGNDTYQHLHYDTSTVANNALNISNFNLNCSKEENTSTVGVHQGPIILSQQSGNAQEMDDLNDIYYSDLNCKQMQF